MCGAGVGARWRASGAPPGLPQGGSPDVNVDADVDGWGGARC